MLLITKTDKDNVTPVNATYNERLVIAAGQKGVIEVNSERTEFGFYTLMIGPLGIPFNVDVFVDVDPDVTIKNWVKFIGTTVTGAETTIYKWVSEVMFSVKNGIKIEIENPGVADINVFYIISLAPRAQMSNRKF